MATLSELLDKKLEKVKFICGKCGTTPKGLELKYDSMRLNMVYVGVCCDETLRGSLTRVESQRVTAGIPTEIILRS